MSIKERRPAILLALFTISIFCPGPRNRAASDTAGAKKQSADKDKPKGGLGPPAAKKPRKKNPPRDVLLPDFGVYRAPRILRLAGTLALPGDESGCLLARRKPQTGTCSVTATGNEEKQYSFPSQAPMDNRAERQ